jgi:hypothetical protein
MRMYSVEDGIHRAAESRVRRSGRDRFDSVEWRFVQVISGGVCYRLKRLFGIVDGKPYAVAIVKPASVKWDSYIRELNVLEPELEPCGTTG